MITIALADATGAIIGSTNTVVDISFECFKNYNSQVNCITYGGPAPVLLFKDKGHNNDISGRFICIGVCDQHHAEVHGEACEARKG